MCAILCATHEDTRNGRKHYNTRSLSCGSRRASTEDVEIIRDIELCRVYRQEGLHNELLRGGVYDPHDILRIHHRHEEG